MGFKPRRRTEPTLRGGAARDHHSSLRQPAPADRRLRSVAIIGLHDAGLTLCAQFTSTGTEVIGVDRDLSKVHSATQSDLLQQQSTRGRFTASTDFRSPRRCDAVVLCPEERSRNCREGLNGFLSAVERLAPYITAGQLIVVEGLEEESDLAQQIRTVVSDHSILQPARDFTISFLPAQNGAGTPEARAAAIALLYQLKQKSLTGPRGGQEAQPAADFDSAATRPTVGERGRMDKNLAHRLVNIALIGDGIVVASALLLSFWVRFRTGFFLQMGAPGQVRLQHYIPYLIYGMSSLLLLLAHYELYDRRTLLLVRRVSGRLLKTGAVWFVIFLSLSFVFQFRPDISRIFVVLACVLTTAGLITWRTCFHSYLRRSALVERLKQRVLFIGWNKEAGRLAEAFAGDRASAYVPAGCLATVPNLKPRVGHAVLRTFSSECDLESVLEEQRVDSVIVADPGLPHNEVMRIATICERELVAFKVIPSYFKILVSGLHLETMSGIPILGVSRLPLDKLVNQLIKRSIDFAGALVGLLLSAPLILVFGLIVYLECPGSVIYRQRRLGRHGRPFWMFKIRSMRVSAEEDGRIGWTTRNDPRCLKIGRFMRRWNIDELPQFWNVLRGDMSLVGPRPERPELVRSFKDQIAHYQPRHRIRPGMTGWAQVNGFRGDTDLSQRISCDLFYLENWGVWLDLQIMVMTFLPNQNAC